MPVPSVLTGALPRCRFKLAAAFAISTRFHDLDAGVQFAIIGTMAAKNPALVHDACQRFRQIIVGIDAKAAVAGWAARASSTPQSRQTPTQASAQWCTPILSARRCRGYRRCRHSLLNVRANAVASVVSANWKMCGACTTRKRVSWRHHRPGDVRGHTRFSHGAGDG